MIDGWTLWNEFTAIRSAVPWTRRCITVYGNGSYNAVNGEWPGNADTRKPIHCSIYDLIRNVEEFLWRDAPSGSDMVLIDYERTNFASHSLDVDSTDRIRYRRSMAVVLNEVMNAWRRRCQNRLVGWWDSVCGADDPRFRLVNADPIRGVLRNASDFLTVVLYGSAGLAAAAESMAEAKRLAGMKRWWPLIGDPPRDGYAGHDPAVVRGLVNACATFGVEPIWWAYPNSAEEAARLEACAKGLAATD